MHLSTVSGITVGMLGALPGCRTLLIAPAWGHGATDSQAGGINAVLESGDVHELCLVLAQDQQLDYAFTSTQPLDFNIHYHAGREVLYFVPEHRTAAAGAMFVPGTEQEYCLMWANPASAVVTLSLTYEQVHR